MNQQISKRFSDAGFTMIELVMVIVVMAALAAVSVPRIDDFITNSKIQASKNEMLQIRAAISM